MENIAPTWETKTIGFMHGFTLSNFLQYVEMEEKTCTLKITLDGKSGYLHFEDGTLINADENGLKGETVALRIIGWEDAQIEVQDAAAGVQKEIETSLSGLLLEAARLKDESDEVVEDETVVEQGILLAERQRFREAMMVLTKFLKAHPQNHKGWLWYSRCAGSLKSIEAALKRASQAAPDDPEVLREIEKLQLAKTRLGEGPVRRCPFCWSPLDRKAFQCGFCGADQIIVKARIMFPRRKVQEEVLRDAFTRFANVIALEKNVNAIYYLCMAHYNLNQLNEVLDLLNQAVKIAPEKKFFSEQLNLILNYMASATATYETARPDRPTDPKPRASEKGVNNKKKVLVVEDSSTTRKVIVLTLSQRGYTVIEAQDGLEALSKLNEEKPDMVLLDIILPQMDGYKILSIIRENKDFKNTPVIMLTSKDGILNKVKSKLAGSTAHLTKPFTPEDLVYTIEKYL
ncbi:MAG: response regulator [Desulfobacterales bacterium]|nr:MAG: response regulator [Desulfobacterales bacterium]